MLVKRPQRVFVPALPEIPHTSAYDECREPPPGGGGNPGSETGTGGYWRTVCTPVSVFVGWDNGPIRPGHPGPFPKPIYVSYPVCRTEWVYG